MILNSNSYLYNQAQPNNKRLFNADNGALVADGDGNVIHEDFIPRDVFEKIKAELKLPNGGTTPDGKFSVNATRCIGCCGLAPVMTVGDDVYGRLTVDDIDGILDKYKD